MAVYKLMQDIEAEDKILGPLTLRQFIFALVATFFYYLCFLTITKHFWFMLIPFLPPALLMTFFAFPFGRDQPTEIWALAKLRFWFKPRKRIWDQSGVKELVTITVPKKIERVYTDGLSQNEVHSRLQALANTIDSRGWAVKNANLSDYNPNPIITMNSDRLLDITTIPQAVPDEQIMPGDDILDERNNPIAQQFDSMMTQSSQAHRQQLINQMNSSAPAPAVSSDPWFMAGAKPVDAASETAEEAALVARSKAESDARQVSYGHMRTLQPASAQPAVPVPVPSPVDDSMSAMTDEPDAAILELANNNDLDIATLARQAQKTKDNETGSGDGEVVISLR